MKTFLWIIFCATCQITSCSKIMIVKNITDNVSDCSGAFCIMNVSLNSYSTGKCETFHFNISSNGDHFEVIMNETVKNIKLWFLKDQQPSHVCKHYNGNNCHACATTMKYKKYLTDPEKSCEEATYKESACSGKEGSKYVLQVNGTQTACVTCINSTATISSSTTSPETISCSEASMMMDDLKYIADEMEDNNDDTEEIDEDDVNGLVYIQNRSTESKDVMMFSSSDQNEITVTEPQNIEQKNYSWYVKISEEAFNKSRLENNGSAFVGLLQFKNMDADHSDKNLIVLNNEIYGISMGTNISNLTDNIEIFIRMKNLIGNVSCNSWDGRGNLIWTTSGCETEIINKTIIKCSCSHLTFFAVLMSIPNANITSSHVDTLTYISYIGCGLSMFFLGIALFMHFLLRQYKSSQSTKILINMFVALFTLNLSFLSNESIADTQSSSACTVIALIMHYSMLSTFTWFFLQALQMYFWLTRQNITIKNYMKKMIVSGWVCSCPVVVIIAALGEYKSVIIKSTAEKTTRMCWTTNHYIHYIVNIGYYSLVFTFTAGVLVMIVAKMIQARNMRVGDVKKGPLKTRVMMILSLFVLLGLTWAVAFFSYGDMIIPSYYIFCVLNSFQGFFLFLYYYHIRNDAERSFSEDPDTSSNTIN